MTTAARLTQAALDVLTGTSQAEVRLTQVAQELLITESAQANVTGLFLEVFMAAPVLFTGSTFVTLRVSGVSVTHAIGRAPLTVSAEWVDSSGDFIGGTFAFTFAGVVNETGFVSTAVTSEVTRTFQYGGGNLTETRLVSAEISDATTSLSINFLIHPRAQAVPTPFDGNVVIESQPKRRIIPT